MMENISFSSVSETFAGYVARDNEAPSHAPKRRAPKRRAPKRALNAENLQPKEVEINPDPDFHMSKTEEAVSPLTQTEAQEAATPPIPPQPGVQSQPRDVLLKKIAGLPVNLDKIREVEGGFYSKTPDKIFGKRKGKDCFGFEDGCYDWNKIKGTPSSNLSLCCVYESETKKEKADAKNEKKHEKAVKRAGVEAATAKLRAKKTVVVAEKAKTDMEKKLVVLRSLERVRVIFLQQMIVAAAAARDAAAMSRAEDGAALQLNDDDDEEEGRPTYEHVSSDDDT
ncbi:hypothetical protein Tco_0779964 [Tanacetum coccineum]